MSKRRDNGSLGYALRTYRAFADETEGHEIGCPCARCGAKREWALEAVRRAQVLDDATR
jgi:hypothetical protein